MLAIQQVCWSAFARELQEQSKRSSEQIEGLNSRVAELDADNRALRDQKYQLDSQVGGMNSYE